MDAYFICLANSLKRGGRCIAGVEVTISGENWLVVRKDNGSPKWIRPIDAITDYGEITIVEACNIPLLSIVKLEDIKPIPNQSHTEDVHYSRMKVIGRVSASQENLNQFIDRYHKVVFYGKDRAIDIPTYMAGDHSLMFIQADSAQITTEESLEKIRYRMLLTYNGVVYDLSLTDPYFISALKEHRVEIGNIPKVYVTLSLGLVYEERHHKLIAGVFIPSENTSLPKNTFIQTEKNKEIITVRPLTKEERKAIKHAFAVPTQKGLVLCFKWKNGDENFLPLDADSNAEAWDKIRLKDLQLTIFSNDTKVAKIIRKKKRFAFLHFLTDYIKDITNKHQ